MIHELLTQALSSVACVGAMTGAALITVGLLAFLRSAAQESEAYARAARRAFRLDGEEE